VRLCRGRNSRLGVRRRCSLGPSYVGNWPTAKRAWAEAGGVEPLLVLVASRDETPSDLADDPGMHVFEPEPG